MNSKPRSISPSRGLGIIRAESRTWIPLPPPAPRVHGSGRSAKRPGPIHPRDLLPRIHSPPPPRGKPKPRSRQKRKERRKRRRSSNQEKVTMIDRNEMIFFCGINLGFFAVAVEEEEREGREGEWNGEAAARGNAAGTGTENVTEECAASGLAVWVRSRGKPRLVFFFFRWEILVGFCRQKRGSHMEGKMRWRGAAPLLLYLHWY